MTQTDSGLRVSTTRGTAEPNQEPEEEQPGSEAFYSPSASQDASPAGKPSLHNHAFSHVLCLAIQSGLCTVQWRDLCVRCVGGCFVSCCQVWFWTVLLELLWVPYLQKNLLLADGIKVATPPPLTT